jgi:hypothetical protein
METPYLEAMSNTVASPAQAPAPIAPSAPTAPAQPAGPAANPFLPGRAPFPIEYLVKSFGPTDPASPRRDAE